MGMSDRAGVARLTLRIERDLLARSHLLTLLAEYASFDLTVDGAKSKAELRMMFVWSEQGEPVLLNNLVRMSQGKMMGVNFNKDKTWVGSSIALHER